MKYLFLFLFASITCVHSFAQQARPSLLYKSIESKLQQHIVFEEVSLFTKTEKDNKYGTDIVSSYAVLTPDKTLISKIFRNKKAAIKLSLPGTNNQVFTLLLAEEKINSTDDFLVNTMDQNGSKKTTTGPGLHYRGYLQGDNTSFASISIFSNGEVMGLFAGREGDFVLGKMKNKNEDYVLYKSDNMLVPPGYDCAADKLEENYLPNQTSSVAALPVPTDVPALLCKKVRLYWEAGYTLYSYNFGSNLTSTQNYLTGLFNIFSTLYQNEGIIVELASVTIWTAQDPYLTTGSSPALNSFRSRWNGLGNAFDGDAAHLIAGGTTNYGGVAYVLSSQCNKPYAYAYSNVRGTYQAFPSYSWDTEVVTHETGHNFGSKHTHWCGWNTGTAGACGAIDNCSAIEASSGCDSCGVTTSITALPPGFKGTIMSYCHLRSGIGISLANGFGPLPQATIRTNVSTGSCLTTTNFWTGTASTAWENTRNWSCASIPTTQTDVVITGGLTNYPIISSAAVCRSIKQVPGTTVKVNPTYTLIVAGPPKN